ncbi:hypothetical protein B0H10DRAFT_2090344, partial [Mycena sp. CBHHK59/15]
LRNNNAIKPGDNILIYFAGHGASYKLENYYSESESYAAIGAIEALCPVDRGTLDDRDRDHAIPDISDRELNHILSDIRRAKGDRITVILDCCYAAGVTRRAGVGVRNTRPLTSGLDLMFKFAGFPSISAPDWEPDMSSHVVLAACTENQEAAELERHDGTYQGVFTHSLIGILQHNGSLSYRELIDSVTLALPEELKYVQTPVVAGDKKESLLWYGQ